MLVYLFLHFVPVLLELFSGLVVESLLNCEQSVTHLLVLLHNRVLLVAYGLVALLLLGEQNLMFLLHHQIVSLLVIGINLPITKYLVPCVLLLQRLNLPLIHMVMHKNLLLLEVYSHLGNLLLGWDCLVLLDLQYHFLDAHFAHVIIVVVVVLSSVHFVTGVFDECHTAANDEVVPIGIDLHGLLPDLFYAFDHTVVVTIRVVRDNPHPAINFNNLLPMRFLSRTIELHSLELERVPILPL